MKLTPVVIPLFTVYAAARVAKPAAPIIAHQPALPLDVNLYSPLDPMKGSIPSNMFAPAFKCEFENHKGTIRFSITGQNFDLEKIGVYGKGLYDNLFACGWIYQWVFDYNSRPWKAFGSYPNGGVEGWCIERAIKAAGGLNAKGQSLGHCVPVEHTPTGWQELDNIAYDMGILAKPGAFQYQFGRAFTLDAFNDINNGEQVEWGGATTSIYSPGSDDRIPPPNDTGA